MDKPELAVTTLALGSDAISTVGGDTKHHGHRRAGNQSGHSPTLQRTWANNDGRGARAGVLT